MVMAHILWGRPDPAIGKGWPTAIREEIEIFDSGSSSGMDALMTADVQREPQPPWPREDLLQERRPRPPSPPQLPLWRGLRQPPLQRFQQQPLLQQQQQLHLSADQQQQQQPPFQQRYQQVEQPPVQPKQPLQQQELPLGPQHPVTAAASAKAEAEAITTIWPSSSHSPPAFIPSTTIGGGQSSRGSEAHVLGHCRPCRFVQSKAGCKNGSACNFCHLEHDRQPRCRRPWKAKRERCKHLVKQLDGVEDSEEEAQIIERLAKKGSYMCTVIRGKLRVAGDSSAGARAGATPGQAEELPEPSLGSRSSGS